MQLPYQSGYSGHKWSQKLIVTIEELTILISFNAFNWSSSNPTKDFLIFTDQWSSE